MKVTSPPPSPRPPSPPPPSPSPPSSSPSFTGNSAGGANTPPPPVGADQALEEALGQAVGYMATTGLMAIYEQIQEDDPEEE